jgi:hypothetical protein
VYAADECAAFVEYMLDLHAGRIELEGFGPRASGEWQRTHNQHWYDPVARRWLIEPRLEAPLRQCLNDEVEGIQTMYFWVGSEQGRHQDQFYLPGCISAWIALQDVDVGNGAMLVQPGSHRGRLLTGDDFAAGAEFAGWDYNAAVDVLCERNGGEEVAVEVKQGDVVFFDGVLVHRGGPILERGSFRHALANHYIARGLADWPHGRWPRVAFDGSERHYPLPESA